LNGPAASAPTHSALRSCGGNRYSLIIESSLARKPLDGFIYFRGLEFSSCQSRAQLRGGEFAPGEQRESRGVSVHG
jgi:hypothetical protein